MNAESPRDQDKFRRYRARKKAAGLKEYRIWAPDWNTLEFRAEMELAAPYFAELAKCNSLIQFADECLADSFRAIEVMESKGET